MSSPCCVTASRASAHQAANMSGNATPGRVSLVLMAEGRVRRARRALSSAHPLPANNIFSGTHDDEFNVWLFPFCRSRSIRVFRQHLFIPLGVSRLALDVLFIKPRLYAQLVYQRRSSSARSFPQKHTRL